MLFFFIIMRRNIFGLSIVLLVSLVTQSAFAEDAPPQAATTMPASPATPETELQTSPESTASGPAADPPATSPSSAQDSANDQADLARLDGMLKHFASQERNVAVWGGISLLAIGAAGISAGVATDALEPTRGSSSFPFFNFGVAVAAGGVTVLALHPFVFPFEQLSRYADQRRAAGGKIEARSGEIVAAIESEWRAKADSSRTSRRTVGAVGLGLGTLSVAAGTYLAITSDSGRSSAQSDAAFLFIPGAIVMGMSLRALFVEEPVESAWKVYESARSSRASLKSTRFGCAPIPGGGVLGIGGTF